MAYDPKFKNQLVLVTGPSGAGRSTAINVLEDLGYEAIDNLPLSLLPRLLEISPEFPMAHRPLALGIDARNRDFSTDALLGLIDELSSSGNPRVTVLYLDCKPGRLIRRFSETRRRHPLAPAENPEVGIRRELDLLAAVRERADTLIDTTDLNVHQLREEVERWFAPEGSGELAVSLQSFSYKRGLPRGVDMIFDCRFLANPYWEPALRSCDGRDPEVIDYIRKDDRFKPFLTQVFDLTQFLLPAFAEEGKSYLTIAFGCTGGQHRSVALVETLAKTLAEAGQQVSIRHRELERRSAG